MKKQETGSLLFVGEVIDRYQLIRPLKITDQCEVWCARCLTKGSPVAIKVLHPESDRADHFRAIASTLTELTTPSIIRVYKTIEYAQMPMSIMEYAEGGTLRQRLSNRGRLQLNESIYLLRSLLHALEALHARKIVHRDIKPENIFLTQSGEVRLGDLDLAKLPDFPEVESKVFGTASYMSPEQAIDSTKVDFRSDFFSLGLVLFEALTGARRYPKGTFSTVLKMIISDRSEPPVVALSKFSTNQLARLLGRMMEHEISMRPKSAIEILAQLESMAICEAPIIES